jgi:hypothetical protein
LGKRSTRVCTSSQNIRKQEYKNVEFQLIWSHLDVESPTAMIKRADGEKISKNANFVNYLGI